MNENNQAIFVRSLKKSFHRGLLRKRTEALRGLDLDVRPGEIFGFLGPNGAGKTTTLKILVGLLRASGGEARLFGREVTDEEARRRVAYLPELPDFYDYLTPLEFLRHCGALSGLDASAVKKRAPELLERVGLDKHERRSLRKFSKGMLQRLGIAQTLLGDPDLFILDEPMTGLDPIGRRFFKDLILSLGKEGKTVFFSSHILADAEAMCDRVAFVFRGRVVAGGSLSEVLRTHAGNFEILVEGSALRADPESIALAKEVRASGEDTLFILNKDQRPESVLPRLLSKGYALLSLQRPHPSLEDVFVQTMKNPTAEKTP
jgi:ABC-2 type transport system ATP-binding protein